METFVCLTSNCWVVLSGFVSTTCFVYLLKHTHNQSKETNQFLLSGNFAKMHIRQNRTLLLGGMWRGRTQWIQLHVVPEVAFELNSLQCSDFIGFVH